MIRFVPVEETNVERYQLFERDYEASLKPYQSRIRPKRWETFRSLYDKKMLAWSYLVWEKRLIGSVWLEKDREEERTAPLGIFIVDEKMRGHGLGREAILRFIDRWRGRLGVDEIRLHVRADNPRAIACYKACGFTEQRRFVNRDRVRVIVMSRTL